MSEGMPAESLTVILEALANVQEQLDRISHANTRIEAVQQDTLRRLDDIVASQSAIAGIAAHAHAAARGAGTPLPLRLADDPILEQFLLTQPVDRAATGRAVVDWSKAAVAIGSTELAGILAHLYQPSPTDTSETRLLRYQFAAIGRDELQGRGVTPPPAPTSTRADDRSEEAAQQRSAELARLWRAGESAALLAEPELAAALNMFEAAERRGVAVPEEQLAAELANLHRTLGDRIEAGERLSDNRDAGGREDSPSAAIEPEPQR